MANHKFEREFRDAKKSLQASQSATLEASEDVYETGVDLFRKGIERNIELQKHLLELASQQNAETVDLWRTMFGHFPFTEPMFTLAEQSVENFIELRRNYLDIFGGQTSELADSAKTQAEQTVRDAHNMTVTTAQRERQRAA